MPTPQCEQVGQVHQDCIEPGELLKEARRREMETQIKSTKAMMIIAHFINTRKKKYIVFSLNDLLFIQG